MPKEELHAPQQEQNDPALLIASLGMAKLVTLEQKLAPPMAEEDEASHSLWFDVVEGERKARTNALDRLTHLPFDRRPASYNQEKGALAYVAAVRKSIGGLIVTDHGYGYDSKENKQAISELLKPHLSGDQSKADLQEKEISPEDYERFVQKTLRGLITAPRYRVARHAFEEERTRILQDLFPYLTPHPSLFTSEASKKNIYWSQIEEAQRAIDGIDYRLPFPDFFHDLSIEQQAEVVATVAKECQTLIQLLPEKGNWASRIESGGRALVRHSIHDLQQAIEGHPHLDKAAICKAFLNMDRPFIEQLQVLQVQYQYKKNLRLSHEGEKIEKVQAVTPEMSEKLLENQRRMRELLADPQINRDIIGLKAGDTIKLSPPGEPVLKRHFSPIIDKHLELLGRSMYATRPNPNPRGVSLVNWERIDVGRELRGSHHGDITDLRITRLLATDEELSRYLEKDYNPIFMNADSVAHLVLNATMKSSGKKPVEVFLRMFLIARQYDKQKDGIRKSARHFRTDGPAAADSFHEESLAVAALVQKDIGWIGEMRRPKASD